MRSLREARTSARPKFDFFARGIVDSTAQPKETHSQKERQREKRRERREGVKIERQRWLSSASHKIAAVGTEAARHDSEAKRRTKKKKNQLTVTSEKEREREIEQTEPQERERERVGDTEGN